MANKQINIKPSNIETIDMAIYDLINEEFDLHTKTNSGFKKVPVLWLSSERMFQSKNKDIRDSVGKLKLPLITIERASFSKDPTFKGGYQAHIPQDSTGPRGYRRHQQKIASKVAQESTRKQAANNAYKTYKQDSYPKTNNKIVYEEVYVPIPTWVNVTYNITLRCEYQQQMNDLITPFATKPGNINCLIARKDNHQYEAFIQQGFAQKNNSSSLGEDERSFETTIEIKVLGYLMGDETNDEIPKIITKETIVEVKLIRERTIVGDEKPWETDNKKYRDL